MPSGIHRKPKTVDTIVGMQLDVHQPGLDQKTLPEIYIPQGRVPFRAAEKES